MTSHLDTLVQPSYMMCTQIKPLTLLKACWHACQLWLSEWQCWLRAISAFL